MRFTVARGRRASRGQIVLPRGFRHSAGSTQLGLVHNQAWKPRLPPAHTKTPPLTIRDLSSTSLPTSVEEICAVLDATPDWDAVAVLAAETEAHALLYSGLDADQRALYDLLFAEGVLDA
jgi:hypothetical protein